MYHLSSLLAASLIPTHEDIKISSYYSILTGDIVYNETSISISEYYKTKIDLLMEQLTNLVGKDISLKVYNSAAFLMENLPYSIFSNLDGNNIYATESGTLVLDWEKNNSQFSLEIGSSSFEYFIDVDSKYSLSENLSFEAIAIDKLRQDLDSFLSY